MTMAPLPSNDPPARAVLGYLAVKADRQGRSAFPLVLSIAHDVGLNPEVVPRVLKRLVGYGLISKDGEGPQGQARWVLHMDKRHAEGSFESFCDRHRQRESAKKSRYRKSRSVHDDQSGTVHDGKSGTDSDVHDSESECPRSTVVLSTTLSRNVHDSESPQISQLDQSVDQSREHVGDSERPDVERLCTHLANRIEANGSKRPRITAKWRDAARLLLDRDGRTEEQVRAAIDWCQADEFWRANVMSMPKLRAKYDQLRLQAQRGGRQHVPYRNPTDQSVYDETLL
ncbi:hypothetical protein [Haloechinothrix salitolerans]|uniref:Helix-turn-helix domain-containing protein n=2 Tax=Haloechinothrix salitolerans TaxID=926830 RepID=A0ABW2BYT0_9PSEU